MPRLDPHDGSPPSSAALAAQRALASALLAAPDPAGLSITVNAVADLADEGRFELIDLTGLDPTTVNASHLVAALSTSFSYRDRVPSWKAGLLVAIDVCALRGIDARTSLAGLL